MRESSQRLLNEEISEEPPWDLVRLVASLRKARMASGGVQEESFRESPSRDAVIEIVRDLRAALFPRHFGVSDYTETGLDFFVGSRLDCGLRALEDQVRRCLQGGAHSQRTARATAREVIAEFAGALPRVRALLETDLRAAYSGDPAASSPGEVLLCYPGVSAILHHRLAHELYRLGVPLLPRVMSELAHSRTGIDIHPGAQIGERFFIDHGTGVVIGETAIIGQRVRLYQGVTLGAIRFASGPDGSLVKGQPRHPIIEDDVVIYAGATVLGRITIGRGATIGGNVWVTRSVEPGSHVTQAKIRYDDSYVWGAGI